MIDVEEIDSDRPLSFFSSLYENAKIAGLIFEILFGAFFVWGIFYFLSIIYHKRTPVFMLSVTFAIPPILVAGGFINYCVLYFFATETLSVNGSIEDVRWVLAHTDYNNMILQTSGLIVALGLVSNTVNIFTSACLIKKRQIAT